MNNIQRLLRETPRVVNVGIEQFGLTLQEAGVPVISVQWRPPAGGDQTIIVLLNQLDTIRDRVIEANRIAFKRLCDSRPYLTDVGSALDFIPGMEPDLLLHAGPPVVWERMCGPMKGAMIGAMIYEGLAPDIAAAEKLAGGGGVKFDSCHHHATVGPMAGVVSASMPVVRIRNETFGNDAFCTLNEGLGKVLRYGAYDDEVIQRLRWMEDVLAPALKLALSSHGPLDLQALIAQALHMGDECHNRNRAATSLVIRQLAPSLIETAGDIQAIADVLRFIHSNDHFFLNFSMPACKSMADTIVGLSWSTVISTIARNGTDFGLRIAGLGKRWFTSPAPRVEGHYFPGFDEESANPDIGDSTITETAGLGGMAMAAAPAIVQFIGGKPSDAVMFTKRMYEITLGESPKFSIPILGFRGTPLGIDLSMVMSTGILPVINTGIAHKLPGIGQVGAGLVTPPRECFKEAFEAFVTEHLALLQNTEPGS